MSYPTYHRKENRCIKRESDTTAMEVKLPEKGKNYTGSHLPVTYPSKERFDEDIKPMELVDNEVYESYLATFFQGAENIRKRFNEIRQKRYDQSKQVQA